MHADYGAMELATKEIAKIAERINVSPSNISLIFRNLRDGKILHGFLISRKEICDRILAKGRSINNINTDLAKSYGRRADKLRSSIGLGAGWHDETSELYNDLVTRFAKQGIRRKMKLTLAIQVQVLTRDLEGWLKDYRVYLNSAENLIMALKLWITFEKPGSQLSEEDFRSWNAFFTHMTKVTTNAFPFLQKTVETKCIQALEVTMSDNCHADRRNFTIRSRALRP